MHYCIILQMRLLHVQASLDNSPSLVKWVKSLICAFAFWHTFLLFLPCCFCVAFLSAFPTFLDFPAFILVFWICLLLFCFSGFTYFYPILLLLHAFLPKSQTFLALSNFSQVCPLTSFSFFYATFQNAIFYPLSWCSHLATSHYPY